MRITDAQLYRYCLPLTSPLSVGGHTLAERRGLLIRLGGTNGAEGWGDAAPLPGFRSETLEESARHTRRLIHDHRGAELPDASIDDLLRALPVNGRPPSVRFAAESAVVELLADLRGESVVRIMGGGADTVTLNALVPDSTEDLEVVAGRLQGEGYRAVKLKVGRRSVAADATRVRSLRAALGADVALRLDANRAWSFGEAVSFARSLGDVSLSYVEEPLHDPTRLADLVAETGLPVAIDETTREGEPKALTNDLPVRAVVLKPTLLGGLTAARRWAQWATDQGAIPVVSASYESGVGLRTLAALAASLSKAPAGLSTYAAFETDVLQPRLPLGGAEVSVAQVRVSTVDRSVLEPVESVD